MQPAIITPYSEVSISIAFEDISTSGTAVSLIDDEVSSAIAMPFSFKFFGDTYGDIFIRLIGDLFCLKKIGFFFKGFRFYLFNLMFSSIFFKKITIIR